MTFATQLNIPKTQFNAKQNRFLPAKSLSKTGQIKFEQTRATINNWKRANEHDDYLDRKLMQTRPVAKENS